MFYVRMNRIRSACVKTSSFKTCFVSLSGDLAEAIGLKVQGQPFALQLQWASGKAFTSWSGEVIHSKKHELLTGSSSVVLLGKKFADSLGLDDGQQILVEPILTIPSCNRINVDPVSANDWEILELHAGYIENQLLNQVRVVFPGQLLPIWIQNNTCVVVQIVNLEPCTNNCVRLDEFTEVIVSPKARDVSHTKNSQQGSVSASQLTSEGKNQALGFPEIGQQLTETSVLSETNSEGNSQLSMAAAPIRVSDSQELSRVVDGGFLSQFSDYLHSLFYAHDDESLTNENQTLQSLPQAGICTSNEDNGNRTSACSSQRNENILEDIDFDMSLRVQPEFSVESNVSNKSYTSKSPTLNHYASQPSAVFVDFASLPSKVLKLWTCNLESFPLADRTIMVKTVQISKLLSPNERAAVATKVSRAPKTQEVTGTRTPELGITYDAESSSRTSQDTQTPQWIVTMVMSSKSSSTITKHNAHKLGVATHVLPYHIAMSTELRHLLGTKDLSLVRVRSVPYGPSEIKGIILQPFGETEQEIITSSNALDAFYKWVCSVCSTESPLLLCSGMLLTCNVPQADNPVQFVVTVLSHDEQTSSSPHRLSYYHLTPQTLNNVTVVIGTASNALNNPVTSPFESRPQNLKHSIANMGGVTDCFYKSLGHVLASLKQRPLANHLGGNIITGLRSGALLICGRGAGTGVGCGKTALAHAVCNQLIQWPVCAHITVVDCIPFRGKRVESIQKQWQQVFLEATWHQPSVIVFDDLDQLVSAPTALQEMGGEALYKRRLTQVFKDLITTEIIHNSRVAVIATSKSRDSLHPSLLTSRGCHVFQCCVELHPPDTNQRQEILHAIINKRFPLEDFQELDLSLIAKKTEGFSPKDLGSLLDRAFHKAAIRRMRDSTAIEGGCSPPITTPDLTTALEGFTPAALRGVKLHATGELSWSDVGGLTAVKGALMETLLWPTKYSRLFSKCPLRMRSGLLLYGPPGTGKTLLAGVVARECRLNFISIKGPELLSKYIGASEQAVRDMFMRAQSAKPCILFFDEFDSLAPRRGHDSTGVTDRVVNQLLTQLDGVEGLDGVYVLAATSRPDLIDPALLRPGRLDKCLYCGIPAKLERLEILQALTRSLLLAKDTNLADISELCENFTGADLKALLYNAQLSAIHRNTSDSQLYKGLFNKNRDGERRDDKRDSLQFEDMKQKVFYIPSLAKGAVQLPPEELTKLHSEVMILDNHRWQHGGGNIKLSDTAASKQQPAAGGVEINQSDLLHTASSMGPSVSDGERRKYQAIYDTFIKSRGGDFGQNPAGKGKATLA